MEVLDKMYKYYLIINNLLFDIYALYVRRSAIFKKGSWKRVPNNNQIVFMYYI